jgi:hypothetical protein
MNGDVIILLSRATNEKKDTSDIEKGNNFSAACHNTCTKVVR